MTTQTQPSSTGAATTTPATPPAKGTLSTPLGPITWQKASDGSVTAVGNGQKFTSHGSVKSDGSWAQQANYAKTGQTSYLSMGFAGDVAGRKVQLMISAGSSRLTLTVSKIDAGGTSGTGTLSGTWNGAVVQWTGHVNLTSNPFISNPIAGWPKGAFATELQMAAFFAPLGNVLAPSTTMPPAATPKGTTLQPRDEPTTPPPTPTPSTQDVLVQAGWACLGAMVGAGVTGPASMGLTLALACAGGAIASVGSNINTWVNNNPPPVADPPPVSVPSDPEPTGPITQTQPDDPPPPPAGDDGSGGQSSTGSGDGGGEGDGSGEGDGGGGEGDGGGGEGDGGDGGDGGGEGGGGGGGGHGIGDDPPIEQD